MIIEVKQKQEKSKQGECEVKAEVDEEVSKGKEGYIHHQKQLVLNSKQVSPHRKEDLEEHGQLQFRQPLPR